MGRAAYPETDKILELDPLVSIPILAPRTRVGASLTRASAKQLEKVVRCGTRKKMWRKRQKRSMKATMCHDFETLVKESKKTENKGYESLEDFGLSVQTRWI